MVDVLTRVGDCKLMGAGNLAYRTPGYVLAHETAGSKDASSRYADWRSACPIIFNSVSKLLRYLMAFVFKTELAAPSIAEVFGMGLGTNLVGVLIF